EEIGIIADGKVSIGPRLTVALVQTLSKIDFAKISDKFGTVIVDEGHHIAATTFQDTVSRFPARYRLWCSATPEREDGLGKMVIASGGPIRYTIEDKDLPTVKPRLEIIESHYNGYLNVEDYAGMMTELVKNPGRNKLVVDIISHEAPGHYSLVLSDRIEHLVILKGRLAAALPTMRIEILTGQLPKKERTSIMEMAKAGRVDVLLATQLAREGLDLPHLDRLFLVSPKRAKGATQQEIGRIMRPCANKEDAVVFDFWDTQHPVFKAQFWKRRAVYQKLGIVVDFQSGMQRIPG
ncbi:MAG: helicase-related protein, partial [Syntrophomonas sp.]